MIAEILHLVVTPAFASGDMTWADAAPAGAVFVVGLLGGIGLAILQRTDEGDELVIQREGVRIDLEGRRDEALEALQALETQRHSMDPADYSAERMELLARGAEAMRTLDGNAEVDGRAPGSDNRAVEGAATPIAPTEVVQAAPTDGTAPVTTSPNDAAIKELTAALQRGELDPVSYARAISALEAAAPAEPAPTPSAAPAAAPTPTAPAAPPSDARPDTPGMSPLWQGAIYMLVAILLVGGLVYFIQNNTVPRREGASMTGNQDLGVAEQPPAGQPAAGQPAAPGGVPPWVNEKITSAEAALEADPKDINALNTLTQFNLNDPNIAWKYNQQAREADPENVEAKVFEAVITQLIGEPDKAQAKFEKLTTEHADNPTAWIYRGLTLLELKRYDEAATALRKVKELGISDRSIDNALAMAENQGRPPAGAPAGSPPPAGASAIAVTGTVDIAPGRTTFKGQQLFVNISDPARPGPPIAAVKLPPGPFPMEFKLTDADRIPMAGDTPIPANFTLKLRLDDDGNAFTRADTDPQATLDSVAKGTTGLNVTLE